MELTIDSLSREELVTLRLGRLFARYGYSRYRMGKFEPYDMYLANKSFLDDEQIITFTDGTGKLMAMKPDVTMSIVKNLPADIRSRKVYYSENVFRMRTHGTEYNEIAQMGVEYIGAEDCYAQAEVLLLAAESLSVIRPDYILNVSHMGFVGGIFADLSLADGVRCQMLDALRSKNSHTLANLVAQNDIPKRYADCLVQMASLGGTFDATLDRARALCLNEQMRCACDELGDIYAALDGTDVQSHIGLDFALLNDDDYYNGINMEGFLRGLPKAVLAGGRYDKLLRRLGKPQCALGFAVYLGQLSRMLAETADFDVDALLLYTGENTPAQVVSAVQTLAQAGRVRAERAIPADCTPRQIYTLLPDGAVKEGTLC